MKNTVRLICTAPVSAWRLRPMSGNAGTCCMANGPMADSSPSVIALRRKRVSIGKKERNGQEAKS